MRAHLPRCRPKATSVPIIQLPMGLTQEHTFRRSETQLVLFPTVAAEQLHSCCHLLRGFWSRSAKLAIELLLPARAPLGPSARGMAMTKSLWGIEVHAEKAKVKTLAFLPYALDLCSLAVELAQIEVVIWQRAWLIAVRSDGGRGEVFEPCTNPL